MPFNPTDYGSGSSVVLEFDIVDNTQVQNSSDAPISTTEDAKTILDAAGVANNFTQATTTKRPEWLTNRTPGGAAALQSICDGVVSPNNTYFVNSTDLDLARNVPGLTIIVVHKFEAQPQTRGGLCFFSGADQDADNRFRAYMDTGWTLETRRVDGVSGASRSGGTAVVDRWYASVFVSDYSLGESAVYAFGQTDETTQTIITRASTGDSLGNTSDTDSGGWLHMFAEDPYGARSYQGEISYACCYNEALSESDCQDAAAAVFEDKIGSVLNLTNSSIVGVTPRIIGGTGTLPSIPLEAEFNTIINNLKTRPLGMTVSTNPQSYTEIMDGHVFFVDPFDYTAESYPWYYDGIRCCLEVEAYTGDSDWRVAARNCYNNEYKPLIGTSYVIQGWRYFPKGLQLLYDIDAVAQARLDVEGLALNNVWRTTAGSAFSGDGLAFPRIKFSAATSGTFQVGETLSHSTAGIFGTVYEQTETTSLHFSQDAGTAPTVPDSGTITGLTSGATGQVLAGGVEQFGIQSSPGLDPNTFIGSIDIGYSRENAYLVNGSANALVMGFDEPNYHADAVAVLKSIMTQWADTDARFHKPFMAGLTAEAARFLHDYNGDVTLPNLVRDMLETHYQICWDEPTKSFLYQVLEDQNLPGLQPVLNNLITAEMMWLAVRLVDDTWRSRADASFEGIVNWATNNFITSTTYNFWSGKETSQFLKACFDYLRLREEYDVLIAGPGSHLEFGIDPPLNVGNSTVINGRGELLGGTLDVVGSGPIDIAQPSIVGVLSGVLQVNTLGVEAPAGSNVGVRRRRRAGT